MHLRIQTYGKCHQKMRACSHRPADKVDSQKVLEKGLDDLIALCDTVLEKFESAAAEADVAQET
jgi:DNA-directed RNA polymerase subunit L